MENVDVSVLFDRKRVVHWRSLAPVIKVITEGLIDVSGDDFWYDLEIVEEHSDRKNDDEYWYCYLRDMTSVERKITVLEPTNAPDWSEDHLHFILLIMAHTVWHESRDAAYPEVLEGFASLALAGKSWSLARVSKKDEALSRRFRSICDGLHYLRDTQTNVFVLLAMRNLMRQFGHKFQDGGLSFFAEAVKWLLGMMIVEVPHLMVWLDTHRDEESLRRLGHLCRHAPNEAIRELRKAHRSKRGMRLVERLPWGIHVISDVPVHLDAFYDPYDMREHYKREISGFSALSRKPEWRAQVLKDVLRVGSE